MKTLLFGCALALLAGCSTPDHEVFAPPRNELKSTPSKTIVLIHGMFLTPKAWDAWKHDFEAAGYTVYAPAWPLHDKEPREMRAQNPDAALGRLELTEVLGTYRDFIQKLPEKPILIGHSMGGLIVQLLLQDHMGAAGVAIDSAPPKGVISLRYSFLKSNWGVISPFADREEPIELDPAQFHYAFTNCLGDDQAQAIYEAYATPESRAVGKAATTETAAIQYKTKTEPLLFIAGREDHIIPASLNYSNFKEYKEAPSLTEFRAYPGRCHWIVGQEHWQDITAQIKTWLKANVNP